MTDGWERRIETRGSDRVLVARNRITGREVRHRIGGLELRTVSGAIPTPAAESAALARARRVIEGDL
jgi:hypothetical protein